MQAGEQQVSELPSRVCSAHWSVEFLLLQQERLQASLGCRASPVCKPNLCGVHHTAINGRDGCCTGKLHGAHRWWAHKEFETHHS